jgi:hypothetical protein
MKVTIEGTVTFDPVDQDLHGRIAEAMEDEEYKVDEEDEVRQEVRRECIGIILDELIGHTGFDIEWYEEK